MPIEQQPRLKVGPLTLVPANRASAASWALPGGGRATYGDLTRWARAQGYPRPELLWIGVTYRPDDPDGPALSVSTATRPRA